MKPHFVLFLIFALGWMTTGDLSAQIVPAPTAADAASSAGTAPLPAGNWLQPNDVAKARGYTFSTQVQPQGIDPFSGNSAQQNLVSTYQRPVGDIATFSLENQAVRDSEQTLQQENQAVFQLTPVNNFTLSSSAHVAQDLSQTNATTTGTAVEAKTKLTALNSQMKFSAQLDQLNSKTGTDPADNKTLGAEIRQPISQLPITFVMGGSYQETTDPAQHDFLTGTTPATTQAIEWKPLESTQIKFGLREQQFSDLVGQSQQKTNSLFADFSHQLASDLSWHTRAEYARSKGQLTASQPDAAPVPGSQLPTALAPTSLGNSLQDDTMSLSVGPSFQLQQDLSASFEFSNRWDKNPEIGASNAEQRVSLSLKGTF